MAGFLEAAKGQFNPAASTIAIDEDLTGTHPLGNAVLACAILRPH